MGKHTRQSVVEVAEELGCSTATVSNRLRAMNAKKVDGRYVVTGTIKKRLAAMPIRKYKRRNEK